jgi:hypothetical protein
MSNRETLIIERLKLMNEFNQFVFEGIMNDIDFYVKNINLKILITLYKNDSERLTKNLIIYLINEL